MRHLGSEPPWTGTGRYGWWCEDEPLWDGTRVWTWQPESMFLTILCRFPIGGSAEKVSWLEDTLMPRAGV